MWDLISVTGYGFCVTLLGGWVEVPLRMFASREMASGCHIWDLVLVSTYGTSVTIGMLNVPYILFAIRMLGMQPADLFRLPSLGFLEGRQLWVEGTYLSSTDER